MSERMLNGLVLAGGRSSRMGRDKASLVHPDGRTLARRSHDLLMNAGCREVFLSLRADQQTPPGFDREPAIVRDAVGSCGPLAGILAAMALRPEAAWLVVACDLPRLDERTLGHLVDSVRPGERFLAYRSGFDGLPEPLCTWYSPEARELLMLAATGSPRDILIRNQCRLLEPLERRALDNANTPDEWEAVTR